MTTRSLRTVVPCALLVSLTVLIGCAKKPAMTQATAPPPLGPAASGMSAGTGLAGESSVHAGTSDGSALAGAGQTAGAGQAAGAGRSGGNASGADKDAAGKSGATAGEGAAGTGATAASGSQGAGAGASQSGGGDVTHRAEGGAQGGARGADSSGAAGQGDSSSSGRAGAGGATGETAIAAIPGGGGSSQTGSGGAAGGTTPLGQPGAGGAGGAGEAGGTGGDTAGQMVAAVTRFEPNEFVAVPELRDVFFELDRYDVRPEDARLLEANAEWLKANRGHLLLIEGHCDERGTNEHNVALGEHRAKSAMNYLISQGVEVSRITIISYGEERPACSGKSESCWAQNRRAHFLVKAR